MIRRLIRVLWLFVPGHSRYIMFKINMDEYQCGCLGSDYASGTVYLFVCLLSIQPTSGDTMAGETTGHSRPIQVHVHMGKPLVRRNLMLLFYNCYCDYRVKLVGLNSQVQNALGAHLKVRLE